MDNVNDSGYLSVGSGHKIYWQDWGNPAAVPIVALHGGPGSHFSDSHKSLFDPLKHRVIFHDQRGCGQSTPFAETRHNTTQDLVHDIEKLREHLNIESFYLAGGSWGSSLSLIYAIQHPERVKKMLLWSIYLIREFEANWVNGGYPRYTFPAEWERFISLVPEDCRKNGKEIMAYYAEKIRSNNPDEAKQYALEWTLWEMTLTSINYEPTLIEAKLRDDPEKISTALLETHYFMHDCFVPENYILDNISKIAHIPCYTVHGRFDLCTPPIGAYDLAEAYGKNLQHTWVNSGHMRSDPAMLEALQLLANVEMQY